MEIHLHSSFTASIKNETLFQQIEDLDLYNEFGKELDILHKVTIVPNEHTINNLLEKINLLSLSASQKSCVS